MRLIQTWNWLVCGLAWAGCWDASASAKADSPAASGKPKVTVSQEEDGATVYVDDKVFTRYLKRFGSRPVLWPLIGPTGQAMTRSYPVGGRGEGEEIDHPHHTSVWCGYEGVNGCDFWCQPEPGVKRRFEIGAIAHREFVRTDSDDEVACIGARNDWLNASGEAICHDERLLEFRAERDRRQIDFRIRLWSSRGPLVIEDSKEGFFALRVASTMRVDEQLGGKLINSRGQVNADAYGQPADWVDYFGPVDNQTVGVAMLAHPITGKPPQRWFVRPYGLLGANPFGVVGYTEDSQGEQGGITVPQGESIRLWYRLILHQGNERDAGIAAAYAEFAKQPEFAE